MSSSPHKILVIGGGVIGGMCAYYLRRAGCEVTLIDQTTFGGACSHGNCGYVCPSHVLPLAAPGAIRSTLKAMLRRNSPFYVKPRLDIGFLSWMSSFAGRCNEATMLATGHEIQPLLLSSRALYETFLAEESIDCDWETKGLLFVFQSQHGMDHYAETDDLLTRNFGLSARAYRGEALQRLEPALKPDVAAGAWHYTTDAHLRPEMLMSELRRVLLARGVHVVDRCEFRSLIIVGGKPMGAKTSQGEIVADSFVFATGAWTPKLSDQIGARVPIEPGKGYSITMPRPAICPKIPLIFEEHRVAITPWASGYRIGSTMEFSGYDTTLNRKRLNLLLSGAKLYLREPVGEPVQEEWYGWRPMTYDSKPVIDKSPRHENVWVAAGHNMLGLSMAPATGKLLMEMMTDHPQHIPSTAYSIGRFS